MILTQILLKLGSNQILLKVGNVDRQTGVPHRNKHKVANANAT